MALPIEMKAGTWAKVGKNTLKDVAPTPEERPDLQGTHGITGIMEAMNGGCYDQGRHRLLIHGGGHRAYMGNEIYAFSLDTLEWSRIVEPSAVVDIDGDGVYPDGTTEARHTYNNLAYIPELDAMFVCGGAFYFGGHNPTAWMYKFGTSEWVRLRNMPVGYFECHADLKEDSKQIILYNNARVLRYNYLTDTYNDHGNKNALYSYYSNAYDPTRKIQLLIGKGKCQINQLRDGTFPIVTEVATTGAKEIQSSSNCGLVFHKPSGKFVAWDGFEHIYLFDVDKLEWTRSVINPLNEVKPSDHNKTGTFGRFFYDEEYDVFGVVNNVWEPVYLFSLEDTEGTDTNKPKLGAQNLDLKVFYEGEGGPVAAFNNARDGDRIEILPGMYHGQVFDVTVNNLRIFCAGPGRAHFYADGKTKEDKGIMILKGRDYEISGLEFSGARSSTKNGAGIRLECTGQITVRNCYFHHCENGIFSGEFDSDVLIEDTEFNLCGTNGFSHNIYIVKPRSVTLRRVSSHHCINGHNVKLKTDKSVLDHCCIYDGLTGTASGAVDIPWGGVVEIKSSYIQKGPASTNNHWFKYGHEGCKFTDNSIHVSNTIVLDDLSGGPLKQTISCGSPTFSGNNVTPEGFVLRWPGGGGITDCSAVEAELAQCKSDKDAIQVKLDECLAGGVDCTECENALSTCNADKVVLQAELDTLRSDYTNVVAQLNTCETSRIDLTTQIAQLEADLNTCQTSLNECETGSTELAQLGASLKDLVERIRLL